MTEGRRRGETVGRLLAILTLATLDVDLAAEVLDDGEWTEALLTRALALASTDGQLRRAGEGTGTTLRDVLSTITSAAGAVRAILGP